ncbi:MAG: sigma-70 family RNA polymerase sigma factor [Acidobacteriota bacterium]|nr:sigma-70 family RNA polymerase sigma factor [Acidobacteriota bacterium]
MQRNPVPKIAISNEAHESRSLVHAARNGDRGAFDELYKRYFQMVHGILLSRMPISDVDDLAQEVFLHAWRQLRSLRDDRAFGAWVAQIARRRSADHFRRAHAMEQLPVELGILPADEESWFLLNAIRRLPEAYRETLILRFVENLTGPEIAALTGLTPDSVRVNLHRGVKLLREQIKGRQR